jgi:hypothetical protein
MGRKGRGGKRRRRRSEEDGNRSLEKKLPKVYKNSWLVESDPRGNFFSEFSETK